MLFSFLCRALSCCGPPFERFEIEKETMIKWDAAEECMAWRPRVTVNEVRPQDCWGTTMSSSVRGKVRVDTLSLEQQPRPEHSLQEDRRAVLTYTHRFLCRAKVTLRWYSRREGCHDRTFMFQEKETRNHVGMKTRRDEEGVRASSQV